MGLELVIGLGVCGLLAIALATVAGLLVGRSRDRRARADLATATATGALPPSLHPSVDLDRCIGSGACADVCPEKDVLAVLDGKAAVVNPTACIGHGECLRACPVDAIQLVLGHERRGVDIPLVDRTFQTDVEGLYIVGELGGMGLIYNAMTQALQGMDAVVRSKPPAVEGVHQVVIVGAGPAGIAASLAAMDAGLDFVTVDQESLGGTVLHYPRQKLVMTRPVRLPLYGNVKTREIRKEELLGLWEDIVAKTGLQVRTGCRVEGVTKGADGVFDVRTADGTLRTQRVVLAMGRRGSPRKLGVPGEDGAHVTYRLLDPEQYAGRRCLVVGGGDSAVEAACSLGDAGAVVHLSYRRDSFGRIKKKNAARLDASVAANQVELVLSSQVRSIDEGSVALAVGDEERTLGNDYVLVFAGGVLPTKFLAEAGVTVETFKGQAFAPANR